jgi:hypothetical protein
MVFLEDGWHLASGCDADVKESLERLPGRPPSFFQFLTPTCDFSRALLPIGGEGTEGN